MGMECIVPIPMCVMHSFGTLSKIETKVKMKLTHIESQKRKRKKKKPHPSSLMQNKKLQKLQKSIWFSLCQEALLCWVFLSFWVPGYSPWLRGLILRNTLHSEPSSIQNAPLHSYSLITIPPNRLHTSLGHRSQITERLVLRPFSYTKCPMHSYVLSYLPDSHQRT